MFKNLNIQQIAEILQAIIKRSNGDACKIKDCFTIMLRESKKPKWNFVHEPILADIFTLLDSEMTVSELKIFISDFITSEPHNTN